MSDKAVLNKEYKEVLVSIRGLVNEIDPMNLFPGCPEDEYDAEVSDILSGLIGCKSPEEINLLVQNVFRKWFDEEIELSRFYNIGDKLFMIKMRYNWLNLK